MAIGKVIMTHNTANGNMITQAALAYEVRMTTLPPGSQWRKNHIVMVVAGSIEEAIAMCKEHHADDPIIDQVVLRNRGMDLVLSGSIISHRRL